MNKHIYWAWAIKNSIAILCWTALAIIFNKWWIALFAGLFLSDLRAVPILRYYRICDTCGERGPYGETEDEALKKAKEAGWVHYDGTNTDYCPKCQQHRKVKTHEG